MKRTFKSAVKGSNLSATSSSWTVAKEVLVDEKGKWEGKKLGTQRQREFSSLSVRLTFTPRAPLWLLDSWLVYSKLPNQHNKACDEADEI